VLPTITPAKLARSLEPFDDPDWLFELKHDGFRSLAYLEDGKCRLFSRHRNVAKRRMGVYAEHGLKIKNAKYTQAEGRHDMFKTFHERTSD
jgi:ATP-dependent DNA ligase